MFRSTFCSPIYFGHDRIEYSYWKVLLEGVVGAEVFALISSMSSLSLCYWLVGVLESCGSDLFLMLCGENGILGMEWKGCDGLEEIYVALTGESCPI